MSDKAKLAIEHLHVTGDKPVELIFREGIALPPVIPIAYKKDDLQLESISEFIEKNKWPEDVKENAARVEYCVQPEKPHITLKTDPNSPLGTILTAKLIPNKELDVFCINQEDGFTRKQLEHVLKAYAHCFADLNKVQDLLKCMRSFEAKFESTLKKDDDRQGNKKEHYESALKLTKGELPTSIELDVPLFLGTPKVKLTLVIEIDAMNGDAVFSFYCLDLEVTKREKTVEYIGAEINKFRDKFICIETV